MIDPVLVPLISNLCAHEPLTENDVNILSKLNFDTRIYKAGAMIARQGSSSHNCIVISAGYCCAAKFAASGSRQIASIFLPGESLNLSQMSLVPLDYSVIALSDVTTAELSWADLAAAMSLSPVIGQAFDVQRAIEGAIQREWMLSISRRDALARLSHLLCELRVRVASAGLANKFGDGLPLTQQVLSDCLGLTPVHLNRVYRQLEKDQIIRRSGRTYEILNLQALTAIGEFEQNYLFLDRKGSIVPQKGSGGLALSD